MNVRLVFPILAVGCVQVESTFEDTLAADGVSVVSARVDRGDITYSVDSEQMFEVSGRAWGRGMMSKKRAERNIAATEYSVGIVQGALLLDAETEYRASGVDFDVEGPMFMDTDLYTLEGTVTLDDVEGYHTVTAGRIVSNRLIGDVVFIATGMGINAEIWPYEDGTIYVESSGGTVDLFLPYGGDYDVEIWGDAEFGVTVTDLGFDQTYLAPDYFAGERGSGAITVEVYANGGAVNLYESI